MQRTLQVAIYKYKGVSLLALFFLNGEKLPTARGAASKSNSSAQGQDKAQILSKPFLNVTGLHHPSIYKDFMNDKRNFMEMFFLIIIITLVTFINLVSLKI